MVREGRIDDRIMRDENLRNEFSEEEDAVRILPLSMLINDVPMRIEAYCKKCKRKNELAYRERNGRKKVIYTCLECNNIISVPYKLTQR